MPNWTNEQLGIFADAMSKESLFIEALAGTGKTTTLGELSKLLPVCSALATSFNTKTVEELRLRLPDWVEFRSLNSLGMKSWARTVRKPLTINKDLLTDLLREYSLEESDWFIVRNAVNSARHNGLVPESCPGITIQEDSEENWQNLSEEPLSPALLKICRDVLKKLISLAYNSEIDLEGQIYMPTLFGGEFPRFDLIIIDEAQDLSMLNIKMIKKCMPKRVIAVGDKNQSMYAFRGAAADSMLQIHSLKPAWSEHKLSISFRCPHSVVLRRNKYIPEFSAAAGNAYGDIQKLNHWRLRDLPQDGTLAILSRNNAPLTAMAYILARYRIPFEKRGQDISVMLLSFAKKLLPKKASTEEYLEKLETWSKLEIEQSLKEERFSRADRAHDKAETLKQLITTNACTSHEELAKAFNARNSRFGSRITISTVHGAKGLEWDHVVHLDPWRIPSPFARTAEAMQQELNVLNVVETRTKFSLILADLDKFLGE